MTRWVSGAVAVTALALVALSGATSARAQDRDALLAECVNLSTTYAADDRIAACTQLIEANDTSDTTRALAFHGRAQVYHGGRDFVRAIADYSESIRLNGQSAGAFRDRGLAYQNMRPADYERAIADATSAEALAPDDWGPPSDRADALRALGRHAEAIVDYTRSIELDPNRIWNFTHRALSHEALGDTESAREDNAQAVRLDPDDSNEFYSRGLAHHARHDFRRAIADYTRTIRIDPRYPDAYRSRGLAYQNMRPADYDRAIADATMAESLALNDWGPPSDRADVYLAQGEYGLAILDYTRSIELDPSQAWNFTHRARAYQALGDSVRADEDRQEAARLSNR